MANSLLICERVGASTRPCSTCGSDFSYVRMGKPRKYCSERCSRRAQRTPKARYQKVCEGCGALFPAGISFARFCGRDCYSAHRYANNPGRQFHCVQCGNPFFSRQSTASLCGEICKRDFSRKLALLQHERMGSLRTDVGQPIHAARRRKRRQDAHATGEKFTRSEIFRRDGWRCGICGTQVLRRARWPHPKSPSIDHITPLSEGGTHTRQNVQCAHFRCNALKQDGAGGQYRLFG